MLKTVINILVETLKTDLIMLAGEDTPVAFDGFGIACSTYFLDGGGFRLFFELEELKLVHLNDRMVKFYHF